jgi:predicted amidohydrolase YtcJ
VADIILYNADVLTMDPALSRARLIAIEANRIVAVSQSNEIRHFQKPNTRIIDCSGRTIVPGFIDAHCHLRPLAESLIYLDLSPQGNVRSISDIQDRIGSVSRTRQPGGWIKGRGYDEFRLEEGRHPNRRDLDLATPAHPVRLTHRSGRAHVLNTPALEIAGITRESGDPPGGLVDRDPGTGEPTGILFEMGSYLASRIPRLDEPELQLGICKANRLLLASGITSIQDATWYNGPAQIIAAREWKENGMFQPRLSMMVGESGFHERSQTNPTRLLALEHPVRVSGVKIVIDESTGTMQPSQQDLDDLCFKANAAGIQIAIHAVEESAIEAACSGIERALQKFPQADHRHRIEHCSVCPPPLVQRLRQAGIWVVTQPSFLHFSGDRYLETVPPEQLRYLYPIGTLARNGVHVAFGSDFPVTQPAPLIGIHSAVTRTTPAGRVVGETESIEPLEALQMHTQLAAAVNFEEADKGSLTPGKLADLVVLSDNPMKVAPDRIKDIAVELTIIDGQIAWEMGN